jgi:bacteriocin-like protein
MRKTKMQKQPKSKPADTLLKTSKEKDVELTEKELDKVSGGQLVCSVGKHIKQAKLTVL